MRRAPEAGTDCGGIRSREGQQEHAREGTMARVNLGNRLRVDTLKVASQEPHKSAIWEKVLNTTTVLENKCDNNRNNIRFEKYITDAEYQHYRLKPC